MQREKGDECCFGWGHTWGLAFEFNMQRENEVLWWSPAPPCPVYLEFVSLGEERMRLGSGGQCVPNFGILSIGFHRPPSLGNPYRLAMSQGYSADSHHAHSSHGLCSFSSPSRFLSLSLLPHPFPHPQPPSVAKPSSGVSYLWYLHWLRRAKGFERFEKDIMIFSGSNV